MIANAVARLCKEAMKFTVWDWLYVLPLYHFMKDNNREPFMVPEYDPSKISISARAKELSLEDVKSKVPIGYVNTAHILLQWVLLTLYMYVSMYVCMSCFWPCGGDHAQCANVTGSI